MFRRSTLAALLAIGSVMFVVTTALAWSSQERIDAIPGAKGPSTSMLISPKGRPFVAWVHDGGDELYFSRKSSSGWKTATVTGEDTFVACYDTSDFNTIGPSAAFTPTGEPVIASACMAVGDGAKILYSHLANGAWTTTTVGYGPTTGSSDASATSLALASTVARRPSIVMTDRDTLDITAFRSRKGRWHRQILEPGVHPCCSNPQYNLVDAAYDPVTRLLGVTWTARFGNETALKYGEYDKAGSIVGPLESVPIGTASVFGRPSLSYLSNGDAAIAVQERESAQSSLAIARRTSGLWSFTTVDASAADVGLNPALDTTGDVYRIAYPDDTNGDLRYATSSDGTTWVTRPAATTGDIGDVPSLAVKPSGGVVISYYDSGTPSLASISGH